MLNLHTKPYYPLLCYLVAVVSTGVLLAIRIVFLDSFIGKSMPFVSFYIPIILSAWCGGFRPGLLATVLSAIASSYYFLEPAQEGYTLGSINQVKIFFFGLVGVMISALCERLHRIRRTLEEEKQRLQQTLDRLNRSEEQYRAFIGQSSEGIWRFELDKPISLSLSVDEQMDAAYRNGYLAECNDAFALTHGYASAQEMSGVRLQTLLPRSDERNVAYLRAFIESGYHLSNAESQEQDKNGKPLFIINNLIGIIENNTLVRAWGTQRNITIQKRAEMALRESEERYGLAIAGANDGIWDWDIKNGTLYWSDRLKEQLGYPPEFIPSYEVWNNSIHPEDKPKVMAAITEHLEGKTDCFNIIMRDQKVGDAWRWALARGLVQRDAEGVPVRMAGTRTDLTDRIEADEKIKALNNTLRNQIEKLTALINDSPVGIGVAEDLESRTITANTALQKMLGVESVNVAKNAPLSQRPEYKVLVDGKEVETEDLPLERTARLGISIDNQELTILRSDGTSKALLVNSRPLFNEEGKVRGGVAICVDITERKQAEKELTAALQKAEAANQAKSEFLANMSHEIRTPMNAVLGLSNILAMTQPLTQRQQECISTLKLSAVSLLNLINDLLDISKIENSSIELEQLPFTLHEVISETVGIHSHSAEEKGIALEYRKTALDEERLFGDTLRIKQIVMNLISNALKFTEKGSVTIRTGSSEAEGKHWVHIHVKDTGIGIAQDKLEHVFDKFTQADMSITRKYGGTGLGLAIAKNLAEIMGGSLTVHSEMGKGSEFTLTLPRLSTSDTTQHLLLDKALNS